MTPPTLPPFDEWAEADQAYRAADDRARRIAEAVLFVGREVEWEHGNRRRWGAIIGHDCGGYRYMRVKVRSAHSGREYWVHVTKILASWGNE